MESNGVLRMACRIARFTREEAAYWYSRATNFGVDANRWALSGMRIMLGGQPADPAVGKHLRRLNGGRAVRDNLDVVPLSYRFHTRQG